MNNRNKLKVIEEANQRLEQSYLKSKGLLKEEGYTDDQILEKLKNIVGGDVKNNQLEVGEGKLIQIEGNNIKFTNLSDDGEDFTKGPKEFTKEEINSQLQKFDDDEQKEFILSLFP